MAEAIRSLLRSSSSRHRPWQLSAAIAVGVLCGLLPKLSFAFCLIAALCFLLPIHIPLSALVCVLCSLAANSLAPIAGRLGIWSLTNPLLSEFWLALDALPLVPWLGLHNSVVNGSLLIGVSLWLPVFYLSKPIGRWLAPCPSFCNLTRADLDFALELKPFVASLHHGPVGTSDPVRIELPKRHMEESQPADPMEPIAQDDPHLHENKIYRELESLLENCSPDQAKPMSVEQVVERASKIAQYVDQLLTASEPETANTISASQYFRADGPREHTAPTAARFATHATTATNTSHATNTIAATNNAPAVPSSVVSHGYLVGDSETRRRYDHDSPSVAASTKSSVSLERPPVGAERQQEALRYLLHHLKAFKEKV